MKRNELKDEMSEIMYELLVSNRGEFLKKIQENTIKIGTLYLMKDIYPNTKLNDLYFMVGVSHDEDNYYYLFFLDMEENITSYGCTVKDIDVT